MPEEGVGVEEPIEEEMIEEEIIEEEEPALSEYDSVSDLINSDISSGTTVSTRGYYSPDDGGAGTYDISETKGKVFEKLKNGLYANLQFDSSINIKQLGASGNGSDDDSSYI